MPQGQLLHVSELARKSQNEAVEATCCSAMVFALWLAKSCRACCNSLVSSETTSACPSASVCCLCWSPSSSCCCCSCACASLSCVYVVLSSSSSCKSKYGCLKTSKDYSQGLQPGMCIVSCLQPFRLLQWTLPCMMYEHAAKSCYVCILCPAWVCWHTSSSSPSSFYANTDR